MYRDWKDKEMGENSPLICPCVTDYIGPGLVSNVTVILICAFTLAVKDQWEGSLPCCHALPGGNLVNRAINKQTQIFS